MKLEFGNKWATSTREENLYTRGTPKTQRQFFYREYWNIIEEIARNLPKDAKILEVGCGRATICQYLRAAGFTNITMLDNSQEALRLARHNMGYGADLVLGDALELPFQDETYDLVFSMGVSEHIDNHPKFFYEQLRILKKEGWMICMTVPKKRSIQVLNIFGSDRYYRSSTNVSLYKLCLQSLTDFSVAELWTNPYPLFTPVPRWFERAITFVYRMIHSVRSLVMKHPFSGSELLCQSHFLITRRSS